MTKRVAQVKAQVAAMDLVALPLAAKLRHGPTAHELLAFRRYGLSKASREMAILAAIEHPEAAARCYAAIAHSLA